MKKKELIVTIIVIIGISIFMASKVFQNDTFYTIKVGEAIVRYGVDMIDHFSLHTLAYSYPHWLYDLVIYFIYSKFSYMGLYVFNIITFIGLMLVFYYVNLKINKRFLLVSIISILVSMMISAYVVVRAQTVTYILFLLEIYCIRRVLDSDKKRYAVYLLGISLLICNVHVAVWPLYFILYLPYIVEYLLVRLNKYKVIKIISKRLEIKKEKRIGKLVKIMLVSILTGFLTPIGEYPFTYFIRTCLGNSQSYIMEHAGIGFSTPTILISLVVCLVLLIFFIVKAKKKIRIIDVFMILGLMLMATLSQRHFSLFIILGMISFTGILVKYLDSNGKVINMLFDSKLFFYVAIIEVMAIAGVKFVFTINKEYIDKEKYPVEVLEYLDGKIDLFNKLIFNEYNFGSYLLLNDIEVFIDSRADLYTRQFNGLEYDIFDDYVDITLGDLELLDSYNIDIVFVYKGTILDVNLKNNYDYRALYGDNYFVVYEKKK